MAIITVHFLGDSAAGKSALALRLRDNAFVVSQPNTDISNIKIDFYQYDSDALGILEENMTLNINDTAGSHRILDSLSRTKTSYEDKFFYCVNLDHPLNADRVLHIRTKIEEIKSHTSLNGRTISIYLVGTKSDLLSPPQTLSMNKDLIACAKIACCTDSIMISSKTGSNINNLLTLINPQIAEMAAAKLALRQKNASFQLKCLAILAGMALTAALVAAIIIIITGFLSAAAPLSISGCLTAVANASLFNNGVLVAGTLAGAGLGGLMVNRLFGSPIPTAKPRSHVADLNEKPVSLRDSPQGSFSFS